MADKKISQLPKINALSGSLGGEIIIPLVHDGTTQKMDVSSFGLYVSQYSAKTGSANTFYGNQTINGNLTLSGNEVVGGNLEVGGMITAQQYNVTYVSSSVQYKSGSTEFGDTADDTHIFTGTITVNGGILGNGPLDSFTGSLIAQTNTIATFTSSVNFATQSLNTQTGSQQSLNTTLSIVTGSMRAEIGGIESYTASLKGQAIVSSSTQITNYYKFAETASANTFYGVQTVSGSINVKGGVFNVISGSANLTSSIGFKPVDYDLVQGASVFEVRHTNNIYPEELALKLSVSDTSGTLFFEKNGSVYNVLSVGGSSNILFISRDTRLLGTSLLVDGGLTGSLLATNRVVSSSNQLFELNGQTGSQDLVNRGISSVTGSINTTTSSFNSVFSQIGSTTSSLIGITNALMGFTASLDNTYATDAQLYQLYQATASIHFATQSLNTQTGSQDLVNRGISSVTGSINTTTSSFNSVFLGISSVTGAINTQSSSQDLVNRGISSVTGSINLTTASLIGITNGLMAFTAALDNTYATDAQLYQLYQATASIHFATSSLNSYTGSNETWKAGIRGELSGIEAWTASLDNTYATDAQLYQLYQATASIHFATQSLNTQTGSQDSVNLGISTVTGSFRAEIGGIEAYTSSLKSALTISGTDVTFAGKITAQEFTTVYTTSSVLYQSGSTKFGNSSDDTHEFTGSKFEVFNSDSSGTMYAVVKNNRARNAAIKTTTTNGSFIAGTSIGTDTFQYQIYDEVEGVNRVTINSQGGTTLQGAVSASQTLRVSGVTQIGTSTVDTSLGSNTKLKVVGDGNVNAGASQGSMFVAAGVTGGDTGLPVNMGTAGASMMLLASINTSTGTSTNAAQYLLHFYFDGNNLPNVMYVTGSSNWATFSVTSNNTLAISGSSSGNKSYAWWINKFGA